MNSVINVVYHVSNYRLDRYTGDYDHFLEVYEIQKSQRQSAYERQQKEISELKDFVARNKARVATRNMVMSRQKKIDKMETIELDQERPVPVFAFKPDRAPSRVIFAARDLVIGYSEPLSRPITLQLERGQKISLVGANGIGKTTLLKLLNKSISPSDGSIWYNGSDLKRAPSVQHRTAQVLMLSQQAAMFPGTIEDQFGHWFPVPGTSCT